MTAARLTVDTNEANGTLYWVVTQSSTAPTAFQVEGGVDENSDDADLSGSQAVSAVGTQTIDTEESPGLLAASGSPAEPMYYAHFMHKDAAGNRSAVATSDAFTVGTSFASFTDMIASPNITLSDDDVSVEPASAQIAAAFCSAFKSSGKHYFEVTHTDAGVNGEGCGLAPEDARNTHVVPTTGPWNCLAIDGGGSLRNQGGVVDVGMLGTVGAGAILCWAVDLDNWLVWVKNGASGDWNADSGADPETGTGGISIAQWRATRIAPYAHFLGSSHGSGAKYTFNFGDSSFAGAVPSGFAAGWTSAVQEAAGHGSNTYLAYTLNGSGHIELGGLMMHKLLGAGVVDVARIPLSDFRSSGKHYMEFEIFSIGASSDCVGVLTNDATATNVMAGSNCSVVYLGSGAIWSNNANSTKSLGARAAGDKIGVAVDLDNEKAWFRVLPSGNWNGEVIGSQDPANNVGGVSLSNYAAKTLGAMCGAHSFTGARQLANFGGQPFAGAVPTGFTSGWPSAGTSLPEVRYWGWYSGLSATADIGPAAADRMVIVAVEHIRSSANGRSISAQSIAGSSGTIHAELGGNTTSGAGAAILSRVVAAGEQAAISITLDGAVTGSGFHVFTATNYNSATPVDSDAQHANPATATFDTQSGGFVICCAAGNVHLGINQAGVEPTDAGGQIVNATSMTAAVASDTPTETGATYVASSGATDEAAAAVSWR